MEYIERKQEFDNFSIVTRSFGSYRVINVFLMGSGCYEDSILAAVVSYDSIEASTTSWHSLVEGVAHKVCDFYLHNSDVDSALDAMRELARKC